MNAALLVDLMLEAAVPGFESAVMGITSGGVEVAFVSISPSTKQPRLTVLNSGSEKTHGYLAVIFAFNGHPIQEIVNKFPLRPVGHYDSVPNQQGSPIIELKRMRPLLKRLLKETILGQNISLYSAKASYANILELAVKAEAGGSSKDGIRLKQENLPLSMREYLDSAAVYKDAPTQRRGDLIAST